MIPEFQQNPKLAKAREKLLELFGSKERGDLVQHEEIEALTGFARSDKNSKYYQVVQKVSKQHEENRGISIVCQLNMGYSLATSEEQLHEIPQDRTKRATRLTRRAKNTVVAIPSEDLSPHQSRVQEWKIKEYEDRIRDLRRSAQLAEWNNRARPGEPLKIFMRDDKKTESA